MQNNSIYLDNAATTTPNDEVVSLYCKLEKESFGNSSSIHKLGVDSTNYLNKARESLLNSFGIKNYKVLFTSCSTEANNLAIIGFAEKYSNRGKHIITSNVEHASVTECFKYLESKGFKVTYLPVNKEGVIDINDLKQAMNNETILVSLMAVNNEIGSINNIGEIAKVVHQYPKAKLHVDTTQAIGKIDINYDDIDMFVVSAHKIHGLKGSGALIAKSSISFVPVLFGGGQEDGFRSGTVSVSHACCLAKAVKLEMAAKSENIHEINRFLREKLEKLDEIEINSPIGASDYILNFSLKTKKAAVVVEALSNKGIYVSSVSACHSKKEAMSLVVLALGKSEHLAHNTIRVSFNKENTLEEAQIFVDELTNILETIK